MVATYFRYLFWHALLTVSLSYSIHNFIIHETDSGTLLEYAQLHNISIYDDSKSRTPTVTVRLLANYPSKNYDNLLALLPPRVKYINDRSGAYKLKTPQVHVSIRPTHSARLPGFIKFMTPIKKMNSSEIAKFVMLSMEIEKNIISPNIEKILCFPNQQLILMNTILGNYRSFTMYVVNWNRTRNARKLINEFNGKLRGNTINYSVMPKIFFEELLNPIDCDSMYNGLLDIDI